MNNETMKTLRERLLFEIIDEHAPTVLSDAEFYTLADTRINKLREHDPRYADILHCVLWGDREQATH